MSKINWKKIRRKLRWQMLARLSVFPLAYILTAIIVTQMLAHRTHYSEHFATPLIKADGFSIYHPWAYSSFISQYRDSVPNSWIKLAEEDRKQWSLWIGIALFGLVYYFTRKPKLYTEHGSAHWASEEEINSAGLLDNTNGVVLGKSERGDLLLHGGKEHVLVFAPTRSGKGVGLVVPTLLTTMGSVFVFDIKGENWYLTSGYRQTFSHTFYFDPTNEHSAKWNPLLEVRHGPEEVREVTNIAEIICESKEDNFWNKSARAFLVGVLLHILYAGEKKSLKEAYDFIRTDTETMLDIMINTNHLGTKEDPKPHPEVMLAANAVKCLADETRTSIISSVQQFLTIFADPILASVTESSDFSLRDLQFADKPCSMYCIVPPSDLVRTKPLFRLMLVQLTSMLTQSLDLEGKDKKRNKLLLLLDEFPTLGRLDSFETALAYTAGYDIRAYMITQDLLQLEKHYTASNSILGNSHIRIAFAANDDKTAKRISDLLGDSTAKKDTLSRSGKGMFGLDNRTVGDQLYARKLLDPGEVTQLSTDQSIVMIAGHPPIKAKKIRYYEDPIFKKKTPGTIENRQDTQKWKREWGTQYLPFPLNEPLEKLSKAKREQNLTTEQITILPCFPPKRKLEWPTVTPWTLEDKEEQRNLKMAEEVKQQMEMDDDDDDLPILEEDSPEQMEAEHITNLETMPSSLMPSPSMPNPFDSAPADSLTFNSSLYDNTITWNEKMSNDTPQKPLDYSIPTQEAGEDGYQLGPGTWVKTLDIDIDPNVKNDGNLLEDYRKWRETYQPESQDDTPSEATESDSFTPEEGGNKASSSDESSDIFG